MVQQYLLVFIISVQCNTFYNIPMSDIKMI